MLIYIMCNRYMKKIIKILLIIIAFVPVSSVFSQEVGTDEILRAKVIEILDEKSGVRENGSDFIMQEIKLIGIDGIWGEKEFTFNGMDMDVLSSVRYDIGDIVLVNRSVNFDGENVFYVIEHVRSNFIYWITFIFALIVVAVGGFKGGRALFVLFLTFFIILKFIIPKILLGYNPILISIIGALFILLIAVYLTEGIGKTSHIAIFSILISLLITGLLSVLFTELGKLSGFASEDVIFLISSMQDSINIKGLLLAGIIIGTLGVLDDVVIAQISTVKQLKNTNKSISSKDLYKKSMKVGVSHLSSMINTLFLAYAGASLPLLLLFNIKDSTILGFNNIISNEAIATEIVRALTGSIGLVLAVPISTTLAVYFINKKPA